MPWEDLALNPKAVHSLYDGSPSLADVRLTGIVFYHDGPRITLAIELREFPTRIPDRWSREGANCVSLGLDLIEIFDVKLLGWSIDNTLTISVEGVPNESINVVAKGNRCVFEAHCRSLYISTLSGFYDERLGRRS